MRRSSHGGEINGCDLVEEAVTGTHGVSNCHNFVKPKVGLRLGLQGRRTTYSQEHLDLIAEHSAPGQPINEAQNVAESSTMTAILLGCGV